MARQYITFLALIIACMAGDNFAQSNTPDFAGAIGSRKMRPATGTRKVLAILWDPHRAEHPAPPLEHIRRLLFGERPSVEDWFRENSGGRFKIVFAGVLGWFDADKSAKHYWSTHPMKDPHDRDGDGWLFGHAEKWTEAIHKADKEFDFAAYDANHDKTLSPDELAILIVIPQRNPFGTIRPPVAREFPRREPLVVDGVRVPKIAEWYTGMPPNLGAPAHELCHLLLGSPDLYIGHGWPFSAGDYSIMDHTYTTAHLDPFEKLKLGWLDYTVATGDGEFTLRAVERYGEALVLYDPQHGPGEYFLIENRWRRNSYDAGSGRAGRGIRSDGLAVWHILEDPRLIDKSRPPIGGPGEWGRRGIRLVRANGGNPLDDRHALFQRQNGVLADDTAPARLQWIDGTGTGFALKLLTNSGPTIRVRVSRKQVATQPRPKPPTNLMRTASYSASSEWDKSIHAAAQAFDGLTYTRWNSRAGDTQGGWLASRWDEPVTIGEVIVRQAFDRITALELQVPQGGKDEWANLIVLDEQRLQAFKRGRKGRGPNDGSVNPVFVIPLPEPVKTTGLRLRISSVVRMEQGTVSICEFEAYSSPSGTVQ